MLCLGSQWEPLSTFPGTEITKDRRGQCYLFIRISGAARSAVRLAPADQLTGEGTSCLPAGVNSQPCQCLGASGLSA